MIGLVLALALAGAPDPCEHADPACRLAARDSILTWRTETRVTGEHLTACLEKLATRTSTVIERLVPMPSPAPEPSWTLPAALGAAGLAVGLVAGLLLAR